MDVVNLILASGEGKRLSPLSSVEKPKQFLTLFDNQRMIDITINRFKPFTDIQFIVTLERFKGFFHGMNGIHLVMEKNKKETAHSVFQGLQSIKDNHSLDSIIIQTPSDHYIEGEGFRDSIEKGLELVEKGRFSIIGISPRTPTSDFGYVKEIGNKVEFIQKPNKLKAKKLVEQGYLWNTAIYIYRLGDIWEKYEKVFKNQVEHVENVIIRNMENLSIVKGSFYWTDIGDLSRLVETYDKYSSEEVHQVGKTNEING